MPVYAYACTACGNAFDKRQSFAEPALTVCETCGGALRKQYGTVGVTFNGSGFYRTDSRAAAQAATSGDGSAAKTSSRSSAATTASVKKPAAPAPAATSGAGS